MALLQLHLSTPIQTVQGSYSFSSHNSIKHQYELRLLLCYVRCNSYHCDSNGRQIAD